MQAQYDALNPAALRQPRLPAALQLRPFSPEILSACFDAAEQTYAEISADERRLQEDRSNSLKAFRNEEVLWLQVADGTYDNFMYGQQRAGKL